MAIGAASTLESRHVREPEQPMLVAARFTEITEFALTDVKKHHEVGTHSLRWELGRAAMQLNTNLFAIGSRRFPWLHDKPPVPVMRGPDTMDVEHSMAVHTPRMLARSLVRQEGDDPYVDSVSFSVPLLSTTQNWSPWKHWKPSNTLVVRHHIGKDVEASPRDSFEPDWYVINFGASGEIDSEGFRPYIDDKSPLFIGGVTDCETILAGDQDLGSGFRLSDAKYLLLIGLIAMANEEFDPIRNQG